MGSCCQNCKKLSKCEYWNQDSNHQFFKIMLGDFEHQMRIPKKFMECYKREISSRCILRGPSGNKWDVELKKTQNDTIFLDGWENFVKDHGLQIGFLLVFSYNGNSEFQVSIFNGSACEVETCHFTKNVSALTTSSSSWASSPTNRGDNSCACSLHGCRSSYDEFESEPEPEPESEFETESEFEFEGDYRDVDYDDGQDNEVEEEKEGSYFGKRKFHLSQAKNHRHVCYKSNRRQVSEHEKERTKELALKFLTKNECNGPPMFQVTLLPTHVYRNFCLTIPKEWALKHMHDKPHRVELQVPGVRKRWLVGCRWNRLRQCRLIPQWATFVKDNTLEEHDVCVFKLVKSWKETHTYPCFYVYIFRVVNETVPFTVARRYR